MSFSIGGDDDGIPIAAALRPSTTTTISSITTTATTTTGPKLNSSALSTSTASNESNNAASVEHLLRAIVNAPPTHALTAAEAAVSIRNVCGASVPSVKLRADVWLHLLQVQPRVSRLDFEDLGASTRLDLASSFSAAVSEVLHVNAPWPATLQTLFEPLSCLPALGDATQLSSLVRGFADLFAPRLCEDGDAHDYCCKYQAALFRLALQYIDPSLVAHITRARMLTLDELLHECFATCGAPLAADSTIRARLMDAVIVSDDSALTFFFLLALLLTQRDAILALASASITREALVRVLTIYDEAVVETILRAVPSVTARLPASMRQQVQSTHHSMDTRHWRRWRLYALSAPCLRVSLAELVRHHAPAPQLFGIDVRRSEALRSGRLVACAQQVSISDVMNTPSRSRLVQQLAAMRGVHITLVGAGDGGHDDASVAQFAKELLVNDICHVSIVVGGYRNAHDAFMQGKRSLITAHRLDLCDECRAPPPSAIYWRNLPSGVSDGPDGDVSDIELLTNAAATQAALLREAMRKGAIAAADAQSRARVVAAEAQIRAKVVAAEAQSRAKVVAAEAQIRAKEAAVIAASAAMRRAAETRDALMLAANGVIDAVVESAPAPANAFLIQDETTDGDSWLRFELEDKRPATPPAQSLQESVSADPPPVAPEPPVLAAPQPPLHDVVLSDFSPDSVFFCESMVDRAPRDLAVSADRLLELVRQERIGSYCNIVNSVDLVDIAAINFTLTDISFSRRSDATKPLMVWVIDLALRDRIVACVTTAVKAARRRQRKAKQETTTTTTTAPSDANAQAD